jgi:hypothetical protein
LNSKATKGVYVFMPIKHCGRAIPSCPGGCKVSPRHSWTPGAPGYGYPHLNFTSIFAACLHLAKTFIRSFTRLSLCYSHWFPGSCSAVAFWSQKIPTAALQSGVHAKLSHDVLKLRHLLAARLGLTCRLLSVQRPVEACESQ